MAFHSILVERRSNKLKKSLQFLIINWEVILISICFFFLLVTFFKNTSVPAKVY